MCETYVTNSWVYPHTAVNRDLTKYVHRPTALLLLTELFTLKFKN